MALQWTPALALGNAELDEGAKELFHRAERFLDVARSGRGDPIAALRALHEHARTQFAAEERCMAEAGHRGLVRHKLEHDRFLEDLVQLAEDHERHGPGAFGAYGVQSWLSRWLAAHAAGTDAELKRLVAPRSAA